MIRKLIILFIASLCLLFLACTHPKDIATPQNEVISGIPDVSVLKDRIRQLYEAETKGDLHTVYSLSTMSLTNEIVDKDLRCSYEEFKKNYSKGVEGVEFKLTSWSINKITPKEKHKIPSVAVSMDVFMQYKSDKHNEWGEPEKVDYLTDYWVLIDNEWYWAWRGTPYD